MARKKSREQEDHENFTTSITSDGKDKVHTYNMDDWKPGRTPLYVRTWKT